MRLEHIPVGLGLLFFAVAGLLIYDAVAPDDARPFRERRRRKRAELNPAGEWLVALGAACLGIALVAGEAWRWGTIVFITGTAFLVAGAVLNRDYLREMLFFRGAARRTGETEIPPDLRPPTEGEPRLRIR